MPRNPNKKKCLKPRCRNYAMRGRDLCRSHLDPILGPRGAGAPKGNLNALKTGSASRFYRSRDLRLLAQEIVDDPENYHQAIIAALIQRGHATRDPFASLVLLQNFVQQLLPFVADNLFAIETEELVQMYPPHTQPTVKGLIWQLAQHYPPVQRLSELRKASKRQIDRIQAMKQESSS